MTDSVVMIRCKSCFYGLVCILPLFMSPRRVGAVSPDGMMISVYCICIGELPPTVLHRSVHFCIYLSICKRTLLCVPASAETRR